METRRLGSSGLFVPVLSYGTGFFAPHLDDGPPTLDEAEARRMVDICIEHGVTMFDTATTYGLGHSEDILGAAIKGRRDDVLIMTKAGMPSGPGPNQVGLSRQNLTRSIEQSLRRLGTDYIDLFLVHIYDGLTPVEETLSTLDDFVRAGKIRYLGVSNQSAWHVMKSQAVAEKYGYSRYVAQQIHYSLLCRDYELDLMPMGQDQGMGAIVWSPLGWGLLTGRIKRGVPWPENSRLNWMLKDAPPFDEDDLYALVDALEEVAEETGKTVPQVVINWTLQRPTVSSVIIGARTEEQLLQNIDAATWALTPEQVDRLTAASKLLPLYPNWHYARYAADRHPTLVDIDADAWLPSMVNPSDL
ncbi:aldo/keto reductase [Gordonia sp. (in: high G+C Gram-positive bacteria)]|uniref:aldo/keto reductase n=1 Tax=Gordonia sp. (in: high G+C Gram-positive bacteria) TaxID=84139 RepID=UPI0039E57400